MTPRAHGVVTLAACLGIGGALGALLASAGFPLPWLLGTMIVTAGVRCLLIPVRVPAMMRRVAQLTVAAAVAVNLNAEAAAAIGGNFVAIVATALALVMTACALAYALMRLSGCNEATALFSMLPGGAVEMSELARRHGGSVQVAAASQTLRVAMIVTVVPWLLIALGVPVRSVLSIAPVVDPSRLALTLLIAVVAALALSRLRVTNAYFVGPLAAVGAANMLGLPLSPVPGWLILPAQILLGAALGAMFDRSIFVEQRRLMGQFAVMTAMMVALGLILATVLAAYLAEDFALMALATAPGSITELSLAAKAMSLDVVMVAAFHVARIFIIVSTAEMVLALFRRTV